MNKDNDRSGKNVVINEETLPLVEDICDGIPGGFFIYRAVGDEELIYVNKAMLRIFGCNTEEEFRKLTCNSFKGIVHPDDYARVQRSIQNQIAGVSYALDYVEYRIIRKDGSVRWVEDYGRFIETGDGGIFYVFIEDATDRMRDRMDELERVNAELQRIIARENQYQAAILHDASTFFEVNLSKDEFISPKNQEKASGFTSFPQTPKYTDFIESSIKYINEAEFEEYREFFSIERLIKCYNGGEPKQIIEIPSTDASGKSKLMQYMLLLGKNESSGDIIALVVIKDITEASAKQRLFQTALSEANVENIAKQIFLSNISRNISNPINSIRSFTEMIGYNSSNPNILKYCLEKIRASSEELLKFVEEALELPHKKIENAILGVSECDLNDLLNDIRHRVLPDAAKKQIHFTLDKNGIRNFYVYVNAIQLEEALWQLLDNAVKYTGKGGSVVLSVTESDDAPKGFGVYSFEVADTGKGMEKKDAGDIIESCIKASDGSGLGLAVVKNITDIMKGTLSVESEPGKGSSFTVSFTLPHQNSGESDENDEDVPFDPMPTVGKHILIVDDDDITLSIEQALLESCGYIVDTAMNGKQAMKKILAEKAVHYDVILLDIQMPVMNGYETASAIRALDDPEKANVPIIAISANAFEEEREKAFEYGINEHLSKPINVAALQNCVAKLLQL